MHEWKIGPDMMVLGDSPPSGPLTACLLVVASELHDAYDRETWIRPEWSKQSCILSSLAVRDFLRGAGVKARVEPVYFWVRERLITGDVGHSLGIGDHSAVGQDQPFTDSLKWSGHLVVVTDCGWLVDTTLYQAQRPRWRQLPGMLAVQLEPALHGLVMGRGPAVRAECKYTLQPHNRGWRNGPDCAKKRRAEVVRHLLKEVGRA